MQFYYKSKQLPLAYRFFLGLIIFIASCSFSAHKYYSSITKIEIDTNEQLLKIYTSVFVDDFEKVLTERYGITVSDFNTVTKKQKEIITTYLLRKVKIASNRETLKINFLGCELENQLLNLYYEAPFNTTVKRLDIENTLLMDVFSDQQNTVDVTLGTAVKSVHLNYQNNKKTLFF